MRAGARFVSVTYYSCERGKSVATPVKVQISFQSAEGYGWTEIHYYNNAGSGTPPLATIYQSIVTNVLGNRAALLGGDCWINGLRVSYKSSGAIASKSSGLYYAGNPNQPSASQNDSLAVTIYDVSNTRKKIIHLRGFWNVVVTDETYLPSQIGTAWINALAQYVQGLINAGLGWLGKDPVNSVFGTVLSYTIQTPVPYVTFSVVPDKTSATLASLQNPTYESRISKLNRSSSNLNRTWVVEIGSATITTLQPIGTGPFIAAGRFNISVPLFISYASQGDVKLGERRMGRPLSHYPGRGRRKPVI